MHNMLTVDNVFCLPLWLLKLVSTISQKQNKYESVFASIFRVRQKYEWKLVVNQDFTRRVVSRAYDVTSSMNALYIEDYCVWPSLKGRI